VQSGGDDGADREIGVGGGVEGLDLGVAAVRVVGGAGDQPQCGLPVLHAPALVDTGPVGGLEPQVTGGRGAADGEEGGQCGEDAAEEGHHVGRQAPGGVRGAVQAGAVAVQAEVEVAAVAHLARDDRRGEGGAQRVPGGDGTDGLADQQQIVGGAHRVGRGAGHLELARGVFGVQLEDLDALDGQRFGDVAEVVGEFDDAGHAVGGSRTGVVERLVPLGGGRGAAGRGAADHPLRLEAHSQAEAGGRGPVGHPAGELPLAGGVRTAQLVVAVHRGPGPAGLCGEGGEPVQVGDEPQIAVGAAEMLGFGDRVVGGEDVEDG
jgi:hypothetical protein